jgi:septal ring factor EnvC (AmiA/AmiB activator)
MITIKKYMLIGLIVNVKNFIMKDILILFFIILFSPSLIYSQSTKEKLVMVMEQNRFLNERLKSLNEKFEKQDKAIWVLENKIQSLESKIIALENQVNQVKSITNTPESTQALNKPQIKEEPKIQNNGIQNNSDTPRSFGQCKAITQKGSRCSRQGGATGYCWQHNK